VDDAVGGVMNQFTVNEGDAGLRLDQWCKLHLSMLGYGVTQKLIRKGAIKVEKRKSDAKQRLEAGQVITVYAALDTIPFDTTVAKPRTVSNKRAREIRDWVIYENDHCFILNKPAGIAVQGGSGVRDCIDDRLPALASESGEKPRLVHRIDRDTSGILALAKTRESATILTDCFRDKSAVKLYWALVVGVPDQPIGTIDLPLGKRDVAGGVQKMSVVVDDEDGQDAVTEYRVVQSFGGRLSWLELRPVTGRTHQLRVHLSAIGHPIYGDGKYGGQAAFVNQPVLDKQLHLHARYLEIRHPKEYRLRVVAEMPYHMEDSWRALGFPPMDHGVSLLELMR
jgi:23S rRNA pseudouridine955/2504/2580 synthase